MQSAGPDPAQRVEPQRSGDGADLFTRRGQFTGCLAPVCPQPGSQPVHSYPQHSVLSGRQPDAPQLGLQQVDKTIC